MPKTRPHWIAHDSSFQERMRCAMHLMIRGKGTHTFPERAYNAWQEIFPISPRQLPPEVAQHLTKLNAIAQSVLVGGKGPDNTFFRSRFSSKKFDQEMRDSWSNELLELYEIAMLDLGESKGFLETKP